jgi:hypothetical protein
MTARYADHGNLITLEFFRRPAFAAAQSRSIPRLVPIELLRPARYLR